MKLPHQVFRNPRAVSLLGCVLVLTLTFLFWRAGLFEPFELRVYDLAVAHRAADASVDSRLAIVGVDDADIQKYGWAINDETLAQALEKITSFQPGMVGVDLYRDLPEPRNGQSVRFLNAALAAHTNIICIYTDGVSEPPALKDQLTRIGFNGFPVDKDGVVRRAMLVTGEGTERQTSLAGHLAFQYL